jgi:hypothetical protein
LHDIYFVRYKSLPWTVAFHPAFQSEFNTLSEDVQDALLELVELLKSAGPQLRRPKSDTLNGSRHANMKELRFDADNGVWRVAYAFDPERKAVLLVGADKSGVSEGRFYRRLIQKADDRFDEHVATLRQTRRP